MTNGNQNNTENNVVINTDTNNNTNTANNHNNKNIIINHNNNNQISNIEDSINALLSLGITHIITFTSSHKRVLKNKFLLFNLNEDLETNYQNSMYGCNNINIDDKKMNNRTPFEYIFKTMDFLRECMIHKGKVLF